MGCSGFSMQRQVMVFEQLCKLQVKYGEEGFDVYLIKKNPHVEKRGDGGGQGLCFLEEIYSSQISSE